MAFRMRIVEVFRISERQVIFAGPVEGHDALVRDLACHLIVDGVKRQSLRLESEWLNRSAHGHRAVATNDNVELGAGEWLAKECILVNPSEGLSDLPQDKPLVS